MFYCIYIYPTLSTCFAFPGLLDTAIGVLGAAEGDAPAMLSPQDAVTAAVPQGPHGGPMGAPGAPKISGLLWESAGKHGSKPGILLKIRIFS